MEHPQTSAKIIKTLLESGISDNIQNIIDSSCCAFTAMWVFGVEPKSDLEAIELVNDAIRAKVIDPDCTVKWAAFGKWLTGRDITVEFKDIKNIFDIKDRTPVRFDYKGKSHWVGVEKGKVCFNALEKSVCVNLGRPVTARIIKFK